MSRSRARELRSIATAPSADPNCAVCYRRPDRRYMDEIWRRAKERAAREGSASVSIDRAPVT